MTTQPRTCPTGKVALTGQTAKANSKHGTARARRAYLCPRCHCWHLAEVTALTRTVVLSSEKRRKIERAQRFDRDGEEG